MSLPQMIRLGFDFKLRPWGCYCSSEALDFWDAPLEFSTSRHAVFNFANIKGKFKSLEASKPVSMFRVGHEPTSFALEEPDGDETHEQLDIVYTTSSDLSQPLFV